MRTKEDIYNSMVSEAPWRIEGHLKPYILEAMQIFAENYYKGQMQVNGSFSIEDIKDAYNLGRTHERNGSEFTAEDIADVWLKADDLYKSINWEGK